MPAKSAAQQKAAGAARNMLNSLKVEFVDVTVTVDADGNSALARMTARADVTFYADNWSSLNTSVWTVEAGSPHASGYVLSSDTSACSRVMSGKRPGTALLVRYAFFHSNVVTAMVYT